MRVISMWQPWATLAVLGVKQFETRSYDTKYRGDLLIHAAKKWDAFQIEIWKNPRFQRYLAPFGDLPRGGIIGQVKLIKTYASEKLAHDQDPLLVKLLGQDKAVDEFYFGDYVPGRFGWHFTNASPFSAMIPERGQQGFWNFDIEKYFDDNKGTAS